MFRDADGFNADISDWNTANVTDMSGMFYNALEFNQDLGGWNIASVTAMLNLFDGTAMSVDAYDNTLVGWAAQPVQSNVILGSSGLAFSAVGAVARTTLVTDYGWAILGDSSTETDITEWVQDFSVDSQGLSALPSHMVVENGQLTVSPASNDDYADIIGDRVYDTDTYVTLRAEITVDAWTGYNETGFGARNNNNKRSHFVTFVDEEIYAVWGKGKVEDWDWEKLGDAESGKTYVVELELTPVDSTLYVYEKDTQDRNTGYQHVRDDRDKWDETRLMVMTWGGVDSRVDNLSEIRHITPF